MIGCLYAKSNKILYASLYKNSIVSSLYQLMNPEKDSKNEVFNHISIKEFLDSKDDKKCLQLIRKFIPEWIAIDSEKCLDAPSQIIENKAINESEFAIPHKTKPEGDTFITKSSKYIDFEGEVHDSDMAGFKKMNEAPEKIDEFDNEEDKFELLKNLYKTPSSDSSQSKTSEIWKSPEIPKPSNLHNNKGFEIDSEGVLEISGFDDILNIKLSSLLGEFFKRISARFKNIPYLDTLTYLRTLHNLHLQYWNKQFKKIGEFNEEISTKIFTQVIKFMNYKKLIQGKLLKILIELNIIDIRQIDDASKLEIDRELTQEIAELYKVPNDQEESDVGSDKVVPISDPQKVEITIELTQLLLSNLTKPFTGLPTSEKSMLKKIGCILRMYLLSNQINELYKKTLEEEVLNIKSWVFRLLKIKEIIIIDQADPNNFIIDKVKMINYLQNIKDDYQSCKTDISNLHIFQNV